ncbi:hypothetical protein MBLNU230_g2929t1 [Neophaeotheca triangularis]
MANLAVGLTVSLPLYQWPLPGAWDPIYLSIERNPNTNFDIIVNPESGPSSFPPASDYISGVARLNSYSNTALYGYAKCNWAERPITEFLDEVATYAQWNDYAAADIHLAGIFVDEAPWSTASLPYMADLGEQIPQIMGAEHGRIWTNPGTTVDDAFYDHADIVTAFEREFDWWLSPQRQGIPDRLHNRSAIMIFHYPGSRGGMEAEIQTIKNRGFYSAYMAGFEREYQEFSATWRQFAYTVDHMRDS